MKIHRSRFVSLAAFVLVAASCSAEPDAQQAAPEALQQALSKAGPPTAALSVFAELPTIPAGVAAAQHVVFVGDPLDGRVLVLSRKTGAQIAELPAPPGGFVLPFIMHTLTEGRLTVLDAGGFPSPVPLVPANPTLYEYSYVSNAHGAFTATLTRSISFASALIGFAEDFVALDDGGYLVSDAVLGSIWMARPDGTIVPGIVPKSFQPKDAIPQLQLCRTMPLATVNGVPFLFSGSTLPGVSPLALRNGKVYFFSPCARATFSVPLVSLFDHRAPWARAADIRLVGATPASYVAEELLDFAFNPFDRTDPYLYAADPMQLQVIRQDVRTGAREILATDPRLLDFPSSLSFLPPGDGDTFHDAAATRLLVVSNQQERTPITNDAVTADSFQLPFLVTELALEN